ncbi:MAG TPA: sulfotransferase [Parafilimonas sp.]|nr:sulfotransferase [Parafilimonas sp.]
MKAGNWLINIPVVQLIVRVLAAKHVPVLRLFLLFMYFIKLIAVIPFAVLQFLIYGRRINKTVITKQPVFILGHYRSGTTYLQKLMTADPRFGFISSYDMICPNSSLLFGNLFQKFLQYAINVCRIRTSFYNNSIIDLGEPAEEERFLINKGSAFTDYWRFVFPLCWKKWQSCAGLSKDPGYYEHWKKEYLWLLKQATFKHKKKQLLLKSPVNTERISSLIQMFPGAKFIYIARNPYHVFYSTCNMWNKAISKFRLQKLSNGQMEEIVFSEYIRLTEEYQHQKKFIPPGNLIEVRYEELKIQPVNLLRNIYTELSLPDFEAAKKAFLKKLTEEKRYKPFEHTYSEPVFKKIEARWAKYIEEWKQQTSVKPVNEYINAYDYANNNSC